MLQKLGVGRGQGQGRKEVQEDLWKHVEIAQFTWPSNRKVNSYRNVELTSVWLWLFSSVILDMQNSHTRKIDSKA